MSISFTIKAKGVSGGFGDTDRVLRRFSKRIQRLVLKDARRGILKELIIGANNIRNEAILSMKNSPPTGKRYKRGSKWHIASSPGNPPRVDTGNLIGSIIMDARHNEVEVGSIITDPPYPIYLEEGTDKMAPRPWLEPAFDKNKGKIQRGVLQAVIRSARKAKAL